MEIDDKIQLTIDDLKKIIHGLHMASFSFVEDDAMDEIKLMIKALPLPEQVDKMVMTPKAIHNVQVAIGRIMKLIELYGKRDMEYKVRYKSRTNLPPRYKVLDYKGSNMKSREEVKSNLAIDLVKLSSEADEMGYGEIASKLLKCAKMTVSEPMIKEAQFGALKDMWQGVKNVGKGVGQGIGKGVEKVRGVGQNIKETYQVGKFSNNLKRIIDEISKIATEVNGVISKTVDPNKKQQLSDMVEKLSNMWVVGQEVYKLDMSDIPAVSDTQFNAQQNATNTPQTATNPQVAPPPIPQPAPSNTQITPSGKIQGEVAQPVKEQVGENIMAPNKVVQIPGDIAKSIKKQKVPKQVLLDYVNRMPDTTFANNKFNLKLHKLAQRG